MREEIEMYLLQALNMALQINGETSYTNSFTVKVIDDGFFFIPRLPSTYVIDDELYQKIYRMSPKGMYDYFTHAQNKEKTPYRIEDIECGCGFELEKFLVENNTSEFLEGIIDIIQENDFVEFEELVMYARNNNHMMLQLIVDKTYFFTKLLDSRRYGWGKITEKRHLKDNLMLSDEKLSNERDNEENLFESDKGGI